METPEIQRPLRVLRRRQLEERIKLARSTIYAKLDRNGPQYDKDFPRPIKLSEAGAVGWLEHEVDAWLRAQVAERDEAGDA